MIVEGYEHQFRVLPSNLRRAPLTTKVVDEATIREQATWSIRASRGLCDHVVLVGGTPDPDCSSNKIEQHSVLPVALVWSWWESELHEAVLKMIVGS